MSTAVKLAAALVHLIERREDAAAAEHAQWCLEGSRTPPQMTPSWSAAFTQARYVQCDRSDFSYTSAWPASNMWTRVYTRYPDHERVHFNGRLAFWFGKFSTGRYALLVKYNLNVGEVYHAARVRKLAQEVPPVPASTITDWITP